jgi:hypothetical protein
VVTFPDDAEMSHVETLMRQFAHGGLGVAMMGKNGDNGVVCGHWTLLQLGRTR